MLRVRFIILFKCAYDGNSESPKISPAEKGQRMQKAVFSDATLGLRAETTAARVLGKTLLGHDAADITHDTPAFPPAPAPVLPGDSYRVPLVTLRDA